MNLDFKTINQNNGSTEVNEVRGDLCYKPVACVIYWKSSTDLDDWSRCKKYDRLLRIKTRIILAEYS